MGNLLPLQAPDRHGSIHPQQHTAMAAASTAAAPIPQEKAASPKQLAPPSLSPEWGDPKLITPRRG